MIVPRPSVTQFVDAVVRDELARHAGAQGVEVVQHITTRLHGELGRLIGPTGFDVLLGRSLVLARRGHPALAGITIGPGGAIVGLDATSGEVPNAVGLQEGAVAIVSHFIELLVVLIGEDLAMRLVGDVWPGMADEEKK
jgi:hypothetical protein